MEGRRDHTPKISIVTPVMNQHAYLAAALNSILQQNYRNLECIVIDGGSTDGSLEMIENYADQLEYWVSEPDAGLYDALNKGFAQSTGEVMGWLNGDDMLTPWALDVVGEIFATFPEVRWVTTTFPLFWDARGIAVRAGFNTRLSRKGFLRGENLPGAGGFATGWIQQESTFWRRSLWEAAGGYVDSSFELAGDFDLWMRFFQHAELYGVATPLGGFRQHGNQKSSQHMARYIEEAKASLKRDGGRIAGRAETLGRRILRQFPAATSYMDPVKVCSFDTNAARWKIERT